MKSRAKTLACALVVVLSVSLSGLPTSPSSFAEAHGALDDTTVPSSVPLKESLVSVETIFEHHGTFQELTVNLKGKGVPVKVMVSTDLPNMQPGYYHRLQIKPLFTGLRKVVFSETIANKDASGKFPTKFKVMIPNLMPNTQYYYGVQAEDVDGYASIYTGGFKTEMRVATIFVEQIHIIDDSDSTGTGELKFSFFVGQKFKISLPTNGGYYQEYGTGNDLNFPNKSFVIHVDAKEMAPPRKGIGFQVLGYDDDESGFQTCGAGPITDWNMINGKDKCGEWTTETKSLVFAKPDGSPLKTGPGEDFEVPFILVAKGSNGSTLAFEVKGIFRVFYV
ncbi:MAG: hypothetical protein LC731_05275 [Acidobacteria bacterium]|nr:hypothetical protein [Acidobacteriota bacterium]